MFRWVALSGSCRCSLSRLGGLSRGARLVRRDGVRQREHVTSRRGFEQQLFVVKT